MPTSSPVARGVFRGRTRPPHRGRPRAPPVHVISSGPTPAASSSTSLAETRFSDFPQLAPLLLRNISFSHCTEVQAATLPDILSGSDVLAQAKTGTGKTFAFLVPSIQRLSATQPHASTTSILILSPTRELAQQIGVAAEQLVKDMPFGVRCVVGGTNIQRDIKDLASKRADILVATPGRLLDLIENSGIGSRFSRLKTLVLDEADRLLDAGFRRELTKILESLPDRKQTARQTLMFSATIPTEVHAIARLALGENHRFISTLKDEDVNVHEHVIQEALVVPFEKVIVAGVEAVLREHRLRQERGGFKVMVFLPTARAAALFHELFSHMRLDFPVWEIHSRMSQSARVKATAAFRDAASGALFSSDVTARGIDVKGVTAVLQVGLPSSAEQYVHRIGRTARAGSDGHGVIVLGDFEAFFLRDRTLQTFDIKPYPLDVAAQAHTTAQVKVALSRVSGESKTQAYQAWLGYHNSNLKALKWTKEDLVKNANQYAHACLGCGTTPPPLLTKTVGKMGLKGVPGLNVVKELGERKVPGGGVRGHPPNRGRRGA